MTLKTKDTILHLAISGNPIIKKNTLKTSTHYQPENLKNGIYFLRRKFPLKYYTKAWKDWANRAVVACHNLKHNNPNVKFPLSGRYNLRMLFFYNKDITVVDLSNLYEGVQDVISGKAGLQGVPAHYYQIIEDDNIRFIGSHDGSRVLIDKSNPRTEIYLEKFSYSYNPNNGELDGKKKENLLGNSDMANNLRH